MVILGISVFKIWDSSTYDFRDLGFHHNYSVDATDFVNESIGFMLTRDTVIAVMPSQISCTYL